MTDQVSSLCVGQGPVNGTVNRPGQRGVMSTSRLEFSVSLFPVPVFSLFSTVKY